jgi:hypothetical protein
MHLYTRTDVSILSLKGQREWLSDGSDHFRLLHNCICRSSTADVTTDNLILAGLPFTIVASAAIRASWYATSAHEGLSRPYRPTGTTCTTLSTTARSQATPLRLNPLDCSLFCQLSKLRSPPRYFKRTPNGSPTAPTAPTATTTVRCNRRRHLSTLFTVHLIRFVWFRFRK